MQNRDIINKTLKIRQNPAFSSYTRIFNPVNSKLTRETQKSQ